MTDRKRLRIGLLNDGPELSEYYVEFIRWCLSRDDVELSHLINYGRGLDSKSSSNSSKHVGQAVLQRRTQAAISRCIFELIAWAEETALRKFTRDSAPGHQFKISQVIPNIIHISPQRSASDSSFHFCSEDH